LYLTQLHYEGSEALCRGVGSCAEVNDSEYATVGPLPVALLGFTAYATMLAIAVAAHLRPAGAPVFALAAFGIALTGAGYSGYLTYVELFVIEAICPWCVVSAVVMTALLATTIRPALAPPGAR
ncbi:MAG TPA: vitamin K epoxide reductase family protein, partial [Dehalococcoidia bacterium]|nr:vitamin K epoxide reductase family protein [Dehalococcoidia bacterium]